MPTIEETIINDVYKGYEVTAKNVFRTHLGASQIGDKCARKIWLDFRHAKLQSFNGRMYRLFSTGNFEETRIYNELLLAGYDISIRDKNTDKQYQLESAKNKFVSGACDGMIEIKGLGKCIIEMKTSNDAQFTTLKNNGALKAKPQHYTQMQLYMRWSGLQNALYYVINKNTDEIYCEIVPYNPDVAKSAETRADEIVRADKPPKRFGLNSENYICKYCMYRDMCFGLDTPEINCMTCERVCINSDNGKIICNKGFNTVGGSASCGEHRYNYLLLEGYCSVSDISNGEITYICPDGFIIDTGLMSSTEIRQAIRLHGGKYNEK